MVQKTTDLDLLVREMVLSLKVESQQKIRKMAADVGVYPASILKLYQAVGKGVYSGFSVPAMNIRGITYDVVRAAFRAAMKNKVGPFVFEIARSEMEYTVQTPGEYSACILAAAMAEGYKGPVFIQGDHFQFKRKNYLSDPQKELRDIQNLTKEAVEAGFYNIDIDASTLVDIDKADLNEQQEKNGLATAEMTKYIQSIQPAGVNVSIGGEIGEIGHGNSTVGDLKAFMNQYRQRIPAGSPGISKISVQTGTTHGGVVLPDGTMAKVSVDFTTLKQLSSAAKNEFGMGGAVQHGASTLPDEMFHLFPESGTLEIHLATGFQNIIFESHDFPKDLNEKITAGLLKKYAASRKEETDAQFIYQNRKRAFGDFKKELWNLPPDKLGNIMEELESRFALLYRELRVVNTIEIIKKEFAKK